MQRSKRTTVYKMFWEVFIFETVKFEDKLRSIYKHDSHLELCNTKSTGGIYVSHRWHEQSVGLLLDLLQLTYSFIRYTNADSYSLTIRFTKDSIHYIQIRLKIIPWKFRIVSPNKSRVI